MTGRIGTITKEDDQEIMTTTNDQEIMTTTTPTGRWLQDKGQQQSRRRPPE
jgi:hypothetical protein